MIAIETFKTCTLIYHIGENDAVKTQPKTFGFTWEAKGSECVLKKVIE